MGDHWIGVEAETEALSPLRCRYAAACVLARALETPRRPYRLANGAAVVAWRVGAQVCVDVRYIPASQGRRLYVESRRGIEQGIRTLMLYAGLTEEDVQAALEGTPPALEPPEGPPAPD